MPKLVNRVGERHGRLTVLSLKERGRYGAVWNCRCSCKKEKAIAAQHLKSGRTKSCGCLKKEQTSARAKELAAQRIKHGHTVNHQPSPTYRSWRAMLARCEDPKNEQFSRYGARGIKVAKRWRHSFENFLADMGARPDGMTLDRYPDNDADYEPGKCRWATAKQQAWSRRKTPGTSLMH